MGRRPSTINLADVFRASLLRRLADAVILHSKGYEEETAKIRERAGTPEAKRPHPFRPAAWTHPNGHPRCKICGHEEQIGGICRPDQEMAERELHQGPGPHPSGTPQTAHGKKGPQKPPSVTPEEEGKPATEAVAHKARPIPLKGDIPLTPEEQMYLDEVAKLPEVQKARSILKHGTSTDKIYLKDDQWAPERVKLHEEFVQKTLNPKAVVPKGQKPKFIMFLGPPGSGKTATLLPEVGDISKYTVINADDAKASLPGYNGYNAALYHEESAHMAEKLVLDAAMNAHHNIVMDSTGKSFDKYLALARRLRAEGYDIQALYVTVPPMEAAKRAMSRFLGAKKGEHPRWVDPIYVLGQVDSRPELTYNRMKEAGFASRVVKYDNSGPKGSKPRRVEEHTQDVVVLREAGLRAPGPLDGPGRVHRVGGPEDRRRPAPEEGDRDFGRGSRASGWEAFPPIQGGSAVAAEAPAATAPLPIAQFVLHQGPGPHPSGSPQTAHGRGRVWPRLKTRMVETEAEKPTDAPWFEHPRGVGVLFHGTDTELLHSIFTEGLATSKTGTIYSISKPGHIYVTSHLGEAKYWAGHAADKYGVDRYGQSLQAVLELEIPPDDPRLHPDENTGSPYNFEYQGDIPPSRIRAVWIGEGGEWKRWEREDLDKAAAESRVLYVPLVAFRGPDKETHELHQGPGPHPSGSPQEAHAGKARFRGEDLRSRAGKLRLRPANDTPPRFDFKDQVGQYPKTGPPGIGYFKGEIDAERYVDCLLWRDDKGQVRGILNHYPSDFYTRAGGIYGDMRVLVERKGNINILVDPKWQRRGIATSLLEEADKRWGVNLRQQTWTAQGRGFIKGYASQQERKALVEVFLHMGPGPHPSGSLQKVHGGDELPPEPRAHIDYNAGTVTMLHGTSQVNADAILAGGFKSSDPRAVARQVEREFGLPDGSVYKHFAYEFARHRQDTDRVHLTNNPQSAAQYGVPEALQDALTAAYFLVHPGSESLDEKEGRPIRTRWINAQAARLTKPVVLTVTFPWSVVEAYGFGRQGVTLDVWRGIQTEFGHPADEPPDNLAIPVSALAGAKIARVSLSKDFVKSLAEVLLHMGPGPHPDGSPQSVHGRRRGGVPVPLLPLKRSTPSTSTDDLTVEVAPLPERSGVTDEKLVIRGDQITLLSSTRKSEGKIAVHWLGHLDTPTGQRALHPDPVEFKTIVRRFVDTVKKRWPEVKTITADVVNKRLARLMAKLGAKSVSTKYGPMVSLPLSALALAEDGLLEEWCLNEWLPEDGWELHMGPGPHPSGSPQEVHGEGDTGGVRVKIEESREPKMTYLTVEGPTVRLMSAVRPDAGLVHVVDVATGNTPIGGKPEHPAPSEFRAVIRKLLATIKEKWPTVTKLTADVLNGRLYRLMTKLGATSDPKVYGGATVLPLSALEMAEEGFLDDWVLTEDWALHYGPGLHPSGSPQAVHGEGDRGPVSSSTLSRRRIGFITPDGVDERSQWKDSLYGPLWEDHSDIVARLFGSKEPNVFHALDRGYIRYWVRRGEIDLEFRAGNVRTAELALRFLRDNYEEGDRIYLDIQGSGPAPLGGFFSSLWDAAKAIRASLGQKAASEHLLFQFPDEDCHWVTIKGNHVCIGGKGHGAHYQGAKKHPKREKYVSPGPMSHLPWTEVPEELPNPEITDETSAAKLIQEMIARILGITGAAASEMAEKWDVVQALAEWELHMGPGPHPSGSPQEVHAGVIVRGVEAQVATDAVASLTRPNHFYRGMTSAEYHATVGKGLGVQSRQDYSIPDEGTSFSSDAADAESYANFGTDDPRKVGKPTYLVEIAGADGLKRTPDGYYKAHSAIGNDRISRVFEMRPEGGAIIAYPIPVPPLVGAVEVTPWSPVGHPEVAKIVKAAESWETWRPWEPRIDAATGRPWFHEHTLIVFDPALTSEARFDDVRGRILVGPKFLDHPPETRRHILFHELGHALSDDLLRDPASSIWDVSKAIGSLNGQTTPGEIGAEGYALLNGPDAQEFLTRYPTLAQYLVTEARKRNLPLYGVNRKASERELHMGPGPHPSGSPQEVHGNPEDAPGEEEWSRPAEPVEPAETVTAGVRERAERLRQALEFDSWASLERRGEAPWQRSNEDFKAGRVPGFKYRPEFTSVGSNQGNHIAVSDLFLQMTPGVDRRGLIYHEVGHTVIESLLSDKSWEPLLRPFKTGGSGAATKFEVSWSLSTRPEEILATAYEIWASSPDGMEGASPAEQALFKAVARRATTLGFGKRPALTYRELLAWEKKQLTEWELHLGPGPHPDGSPQSVHGRKKKFGTPIAPTKPTKVQPPEEEEKPKGSESTSPVDAPILKGITPKVMGQNAARYVKESGLSAEDMAERIESLKSLPFVHLTSASLANDILANGLRSRAAVDRDMAGGAEEFKKITRGVSIDDVAADDLDSILGGAMLGAKQIERARALFALFSKAHTFDADTEQGLDQFVFMNHGVPGQMMDYGKTAVIVDPAAFQQGGFATRADIVELEKQLHPDGDWTEGFSADTVKKYREGIVGGEGYYQAAAAKSFKSDSYRSWEVKIPKVDPAHILGLVAYTKDEAQLMRDEGVPEDKILLFDPEDPRWKTDKGFIEGFQSAIQHLLKHKTWPKDFAKKLREWELHLGPGSHPSGSSQEVHGHDAATTAVHAKAEFLKLVVPALQKAKGEEGSGAAFVSPNIEEDLSFDQALAKLKSQDHQRLRLRFSDVDHQLKLQAHVSDGIGDWSDGAENSIVTVYRNVDWDTLRYASAWKGLMGDQKSVIPFLFDENGPHVLYQVTLNGDLLDIRQTLDRHGIKFRTLVPHQDGSKTDILIYDQENELADEIENLAATYNVDVNAYKGRGEFLGDWTSRSKGRQAYRAVIAAYEKGFQDQVHYRPRGGWDLPTSRAATEGKAQGGEGKRDWELHLGPGPHPSGSPQKVHGNPEDEPGGEEEYPTPGAEKIVRNVISWIAPNGFETLYGIDRQGRVRLKKKGSESSVEVGSFEELNAMLGVVHLHNHPRGKSFSVEDITLAIDQRAPATVVATAKHVYVMTLNLPKDTGQFRYDLALSISAQDTEVLVTFTDRIQKGKMSVAEAELTHHHEVWTRVAAKFPNQLTYRRYDLESLPDGFLGLAA